MRGLIRDVPQQLQFNWTALDRMSIGGRDYRAGDSVPFNGDPMRLQGLAVPSLIPSFRTAKPEFTWVGPVNVGDGYGSLGHDMLRGFLNLGLNPSVANLGWVGQVVDDPRLDRVLQEHLRVHELLVMMTPPDDGLLSTRSLKFATGHEELLYRQTRVMYTMFETDTIPTPWIRRINRGVDALIVPAAFLVDVFREAGVPTFVARIGVDSNLYRPGSRQVQTWRGQRHSETRVLMVGNLTRRKNVTDAVRAFQAVADDSWRMTIKANDRAPDFDEFVKRPASGDSRITLLTERIPNADLADLYRDHDIFLWPSCAEGIGLPPMEAMASGLEVVLPRSSGMVDYSNDGNAWTVSVHPEPARDYRGDRTQSWKHIGNWWRPDFDDLVQQLQAAATFSTPRGAQAREDMETNHPLDITAASVVKILTANGPGLVAARRERYDVR
jgi:glycosyltransferase involved in cell wall biosynthesis